MRDPSQGHGHPDAGHGSRAGTLSGALLICAVGLMVYSNSFTVPFAFDDFSSIADNRAIRQLWPPWPALTFATRPVAYLSFAVNYAIHQDAVWGYHAVNLAIHLAAALVLFGIVRRTLSGRRLAARYGRAARGLALAVAVLWMVHPLQTQAVTYLVQRVESLMGLFYLLTLYCFLRGQDSPRAGWWYAASVACCGLGMGTKEVMVTAPLMVLWYDRVFVAETWRELLRRRWLFYSALAGTWGILAVVMVGQWSSYGSGVMRVDNLSPLDYALTQPGVILHYLRLAVWPQGQCLDCMWPVARTAGQIVPPLLGIAALLGLAVWCLFRRPAWGLVAGWFFVTLAPTSSIAPILDPAFEHRMYLPLAAVVTVFVIGGYGLTERLLGAWRVRRRRRRAIQIAPLLAVVVALGVATHLRNRVWQSSATLWADTVAKAPHNPRARTNLARALIADERFEEAVDQSRAALDVSPEYHYARVELGNALFFLGRLQEAREELLEVLRVRPDEASSLYRLGTICEREGDRKAARDYYAQAVQADPDLVDARVNLALIVAETDPDAAVRHFRAALAVAPRDCQAHNQLGLLLERQGDAQAACRHFAEAVRADPEVPEPHVNLARLLERVRSDLAIEHYGRALEIRPDFAEAHNNLGALLTGQGRLEAAVGHLEEAVKIRPDYANAHVNLAIARVKQQKPEEARQHLREALRIKPDYRPTLEADPNLQPLFDKGVARSKAPAP